MLAAIGVAVDRRAVRRRAAGGAARRPRSTCRWRWARSRSSARSAAMAAKNLAAGAAPFFLGGGAYRHHVPAAVDHLIQRGEFLTSYTPYQPEVAQGTLQYLFEFQTQVALLTGMEVANASLYDGATACAEAVMMAHRVTRRERRCCRAGCTRITARSARPMPALPAFELTAQDPAPGGGEDLVRARSTATPPASSCRTRISSASCAIIRRWPRPATTPGALLVVVVTEIVSLGAIKPPGEMGADIVAAEGQSLGNALNFGGPYLGLFASRERFVRQMPGRLVGETVDAEGRRGWVLTLSTREQHIRREKATSNICTNSGLCALAFTIHLALLGEAGLDAARAAQPRRRGARLAERLAAIPGVQLVNRGFFNEFTLRLPRAGGAGRRGAGGAAASSPASRSSRLLSRPRASLPICCWSPPPRPSTDDDIDRLRRGAAGGAAMNDWSQALSAHPADGATGPAPTISGNRGLADRGAADVRAGFARPLRRRPAGAAAGRARASAGSNAQGRSACRASASRRSCAISPGCRRRTTRSTAGSIRSARAR